jgi:hypothetical protein
MRKTRSVPGRGNGVANVAAFLALACLRCEGSKPDGSSPPADDAAGSAADSSIIVIGDLDASSDAKSDGTGLPRDAAMDTPEVSDARRSECGMLRGELEGDWDSGRWKVSYTTQNKFKRYQDLTRWQFFLHLDKDGLMVLRGSGADPTDDGLAHSVEALLLTPSAGPDPKSWYHSTLTSTVTDDRVDTRVDLTGLGRFGSCDEGTPVDGEVVVCRFPASADCRDYTRRAGMLDGVAIAEAVWVGTEGTRFEEMSMSFADGMILKWSTPLLSGPITNGLVIFADGTIYCAGLGSQHVRSGVAGGYDNTYTLRDFKRVSSSAGASGANTVRGCVAPSF